MILIFKYCVAEQVVAWPPTTTSREEALQLRTVGGEKARTNDKVSGKYTGGQLTSSEKQWEGLTF